MEHEITTLKDNWLELSDTFKDLPLPFHQEIFLLECSLAGTTHVGDIKAKTANLAEGDLLTLRRDPANVHDPLAIAVYTAENERIGWVPQRKNTIFSRLMDAGKLLYAKVSSKEFVERNSWLNMRMKIYMRDV